VVDAELLRPRAWIELHGIVAGQLLPLHLPELEVSGQALVTAVEACPPIAGGEGSVVTARFVTREVHVVASVDVLGPDGSIETITGTTIHPVWSIDREDWVPLGELVQGETLQGQSGLAVVLAVTLSRVAQPVYNLEVHGEHVYQVGMLGVLGVLVHNATSDDCLKLVAPRGAPNWREFEKLAFGHTPNKETFTLLWTGHSRSWGTRIPDDWVPSTGTIQEATKLNWHEVNLAHPTSQTWKQFTDKLQQATQDGWLLRNDPRVKEVIWYGAEALPTTGRGAELARLLRENGIIYRVVEIPW
jgi:hypothetical protein